MADPRKDLSYDSYLRSKAAQGTPPSPAPAPKKNVDLSYDAYLQQKEPTFLEKAGAVASGVAAAPKRVLYQTIARLSGIGEDEQEKQKYQQAVEALEPVGPSGKTRQLYETSRAAASLPLEIAKYGAISAIPYAGIPLAAALGAGEAAGGLKEESSAALAKMLAEKSGMQRVSQALAPVVESGVGRAVFDVALGKALELGTRGSIGAYRAVKGVGKGAGEGMEQGLREGASEAADAVVPSLARKETARTLRAATRGVERPEIDLDAFRQFAEGGQQFGVDALPGAQDELDRILRTIPSFAVPAPRSGPNITGPGIAMPAGLQRSSGPTSTLMRLLAPGTPLTSEVAEETGKRSVRRTAEEAIAARRAIPMESAAAAEAEEVQKYLASRTPIEKALTRAAEEQAVRRANIAGAVGSPAEVRTKLRRTGAIGAGAENAPVPSWLPEDALARAEQEATPVAKEVGEDTPGFLQDVPIDEVFRELDNIKTGTPIAEVAPEAPVAAAKAGPSLSARTNSGSLRPVEKVSTDSLLDELETLTIRQAEDQRKSIPSFVETNFGGNNSMVASVNRRAGGASMQSKAAQRVRATSNVINRIVTELERRGVDDIVEASAKRAEVRAAEAAEAQKATEADFDEFLQRQSTSASKRPRSGFIAPEALGSIAGAGVGATTGIATDEEGGMSPLQRALLYGAAGAAGGASLGRMARGAKPAAMPSIPELAPIMETINTGKRAVIEESPALLTRAQQAYTKLVSETYPLEQVAKRFGTPGQATSMPELIAQKQGAGQAAQGYLQDNLSPLLKGLSEEDKQSVRSLLKGRRDLQIRQKGGAAKSEVPDDVLERGVLAGNASPQVASVADRITEMHRELLKMRYEAGLLSDEAYQAIKDSDDFYTPLYRELAQDAGPVRTMPGARTGKFNVFSSGVRRMDRTAEAIERTADPLEMVISDAARTYRDVAKQRVSNVVFSLADADKMTGPNGIPLIQRIQADPTNPPKGSDIIQQVRGGKLYTYRVNDKDLMAALGAQDAISSNVLVKIASAIKNIKTAGITVLPDFAAANVIRDVAMSGVQRPDVGRAFREAGVGALAGGVAGVSSGDSETSVAKRFLVGAGMGAGAGLYARPFLETMAAVKSIVKDEQLYREFLADGASTQGFYVRNADDAAKILKELEKGPGFSVSDIIIPKNWWETLRKIGSVGEQATRLAAYRQVREAGGTGAAAALAAQDRTLRFANLGGSKSVKNLAAMTPFWNAKVQGWDKLGRLMKDPKTYALGAGMLTAPSVALWSVNKDNPEYWERPVYERNLFWLIPKSAVGAEGEKGFYRIPKPFELGFMFASLPERALDYAAQAGVDMPFFGEIQSASPSVAEPGRAFSRAARDIGTATIEGTLPIPEVVGLPAQLYMNKDVFRDRPIVTRPQLSPELQVTQESSAIARALAKAGISPDKTDFFIRSAFGTTGSEASKLIDIAARQVGIPSSEPPAGSARIPLIGRFAERFATSTKGQTDPEALARERLREIGQIEVDYKELQRIGDKERLLDFAEKNFDDLELAKRIQPIETELEKLSRLRTKIRKDPSFSADDRQVALEILRERGQMLSEMLIGVPKQ